MILLGIHLITTFEAMHAIDSGVQVQDSRIQPVYQLSDLAMKRQIHRWATRAGMCKQDSEFGLLMLRSKK